MKSDLLRMVQVAPINVVSMCDVDTRMLNDARRSGRRAAGVEAAAAPLRDWRKLLAEKDLDS
jgi:hypothetical protein